MSKTKFKRKKKKNGGQETSPAFPLCPISVNEISNKKDLQKTFDPNDGQRQLLHCCIFFSSSSSSASLEMVLKVKRDSLYPPISIRCTREYGTQQFTSEMTRKTGSRP